MKLVCIRCGETSDVQGSPAPKLDCWNCREITDVREQVRKLHWTVDLKQCGGGGSSGYSVKEQQGESGYSLDAWHPHFELRGFKKE